MKSKLIVKEYAGETNAFPFLGKIRKEHIYPKDEWFVVLFTAYGKGTVVAVSDPKTASYPLGNYGESWAMFCFEPLVGKIVLENE